LYNSLYFYLDKIVSLISKDASIDSTKIESEASSGTANMHTIEEQSDTNIKRTLGIDIRSLHKVYRRGRFHALKGLTVKFYQNEISALLGHNGAGKSTIMHLLTGLYRPTSGSASIDNMNISTEMNRIRKSLGFVPQYNVLFDQMTVEEHLWFYARLKGLDRRAALVETKRLLNDTNLDVKKDDCALNLSGGQQRKLSVAIAFVGESKTVILDEPSAGVDPNGRRSIWELLLKYREGRTILISTHHMDEADVLADRIAIVANGRLVAHGTSFL
jgi:ATP-binding cassette, subfamily A (ABC1), member 1